MSTGGPEYRLEFPHGYIYSAHPIACAAGNAALDLLVQEKAIECVAELAGGCPAADLSIEAPRGSRRMSGGGAGP